MAVFYKWIKGFGVGGDMSSTVWSYINWGTGTDTSTVASMPRLSVSIGKDGTTVDRGYLLSNTMPRPYLMGDWNFSNSVVVIGDNYKANINALGNTKRFNPDNANYSEVAYGELSTEYGGESDSTKDYRTVLRARRLNNAVGNIILDAETCGICGWVDKNVSNAVAYFERWGDLSKSCTHINGRTWIGRQLTIAGDMSSDTLGNEHFARDESTLNTRGVHYIGINPFNDGDCVLAIPYWTGAGANDYHDATHINTSLHLRSYCQAIYFNATSDKRAKENITPATYDALNLIKNLPIYNFNYKSRPKETVTGILAQDLLEVQPEGLDLVSNIDATGENNDYMSIKNDKLMFVLMKAIQEQQEQIETLKAEIEKLKV